MELDLLTQVLRAVLYTFILISLFLLIGALFRAKFKIFQKLFLPASVIGGFIGLILGPIVLKDYAIIPIPEHWITIASLLPGLLIVPVVASVPLGMTFKSTGENSDSASNDQTLMPVIIMFFMLAIISASQNLFSLLTSFSFKNIFNYDGIYPTFGTELSAGFSGGHGTAGVVGNLLQSTFDQPYWNTAQGVTTTTATVGLISGILIGIVLINVAARKGYTRFIKSDAKIPIEMQTGLQKDSETQESAGVETTNSSSVDSLGFHLALILMVSGLAFGVTYLFKKYDILILNLIPEWAYAILLMYVVWGIMQKVGLAWIVDVKTKTKIASTLTEFAIVAAIVSLPIQAVFAYILPLSVMMIGGLSITVVLAYFLAKKFFTDYWFEKSVVLLGTNTGVFLTGLLLLKMVDPDMKSPVLRDYSLSYSINSIISFIVFPLSFTLLINQGFVSGIALFGLLAIIFLGLLIFTTRRTKGATKI